MRYLKIIFSVFFVLLVSFLVVKSCVQPKRAMRGEETARPKRIVLAPKMLPAEIKKFPVVSRRGPRIAIILDDWGKNYPLLKDAIDLRRPLTLAVIPNLVKSRQIAEEAYQNKLGVMIHLPMEPYGKNEPIEPHTIRVHMTRKEILRYMDEAFDSVPHAEGANNHMGSKATSDARVMRIILKRLKSEDLYFIDSNVVPTTKVPAVAKETNILFCRRDVFIDNENNIPYIKKQLEQAKRIALAHGEAVVIGHDRKLTIRAIKEMLPEFDEAGIQLVYARDVVRVQT